MGHPPLYDFSVCPFVFLLSTLLYLETDYVNSVLIKDMEALKYIFVGKDMVAMRISFDV